MQSKVVYLPTLTCLKIIVFTRRTIYWFGFLLITVNDQLITNVCHDAALHILRNSGNQVTLLVKHYKAAAPFLLGSKGIIYNIYFWLCNFSWLLVYFYYTISFY